jgi:two-component system, cell cycle response regulator DivK
MPPKLLIVEDHLDNREYILHVAERLGLTPLVASTADEAVRLARTQHPDLILMDILLARGDGRAAARQLKATPETAGIPILAVTALALIGDREDCLAAGCDDYLSKPFTPRQLIAKIARWIPLLRKQHADAPGT